MSQQSYLSPINFRFALSRFPNLEYFVQAVNLPGVNSGPTETAVPYLMTYKHGDRINFDELTLTVIMDEDMSTHKEIFDWMKNLAHPEGFQEYDTYKKLADADEIYSDASLVIMNNSKNPNVEIKFKDVFPTSISALQFDTRETDEIYVTCDFTFRYLSYTVENI